MAEILKKLISVWKSYWFENRPAKISLACIRIAVYISILQSLIGIWDITNTTSFNQTTLWYSPIGILQFLGPHLPPMQFFVIIKYIALISSLFAFAGLFTIPSSIVSFISNQLLFCLLYSWGQPWFHGFNIIFLAQLAIVFSPAGELVSFDYLIRRFRNKLTDKQNWNYIWSVRLVQCVVALMFFNGFFFKWISSPLMLRWVFSDNLRNTIACEYLLQNNPIPSYLFYILNHPFLYKTIACLNLLSQFSVIFACIFVRKPYVRLLVAGLIIFELLGFDFIMHLGAPQWYALLAVFVNWDYFIDRINKVKNVAGSPLAENNLKVFRKKNSITAFISCFLLFYILVAFNPWYGLQEKVKPYPFTRFALYNQIEAQKPYNKHLPLPLEQFSFKVFINSSFNYKASDLLNKDLFHMNTYFFSEKNKSIFLNNCKHILLNAGFKHITSIDLYKDYSELLPYPHQPELHQLAEGLQCKIDTQGSRYISVHKTIDSVNHKLILSIDFFGYDNSYVKFFIQPDLNEKPIATEFEYSAHNYSTNISVNKDYIRMEVYSTASQPAPDVYYIEPE